MIPHVVHEDEQEGITPASWQGKAERKRKEI